MEGSQPSFQSSERADQRRISFLGSPWCHAAMSTKAFSVLFLLLAAQTFCDAGALPNDKLDKLNPKNILDKMPSPKNILDKMPSPNNLLGNNTLPKDLLGNHTLPKDLLGNHTLPKDLLGNHTLPKELLGNHTLPKELLGNHTLPKDLLANHTLPKDLFGNKTIDKDLLNRTLEKYLRNSTYVDPKTGLSLKGSLELSGKGPFGEMIYRGLACECQKVVCQCCAGLNLPLQKEVQNLCTQIELVPEEFALKSAISLNNKQLLGSTLTGKNPPPFCVPLPHLNAVTVCVRVYDLGVFGRNLRGCVDLETRIIEAPVFKLHFNCVSMGLDGLSLSPPGSSDSFNLPKPQDIIQEIYDHVNFEPNKQENDDSSSSSAEDSQVGQLKY